MPTAINTRTYSELMVLNPEFAIKGSGRLPGGVDLPAGTALGFPGIVRRDEVQTITLTGAVGSFGLRLDDNPSGPTPVTGLTSAIIQAAYDRMIGRKMCVVTGAGPYTVTFAGEYGSTDVAMTLVDSTALTAGTVVVTETTKGSPGPDEGLVFADGTVITARVLLTTSTKTDAKGAVDGEFGAANQFSVPFFTLCEVEAVNLPPLTRTVTIAGQLGRIIRGVAITSDGCVLRVGV